MVRVCIFILLVTSSCSTSDQEPIFHLFKHSKEHPSYNEIHILRKENFKDTSYNNQQALTKTEDGVEIIYLLDNNKQLNTKISRHYVNSFDTISANTVIKNYNGNSDKIWKTINDSTLTTTVSFQKQKIDIQFIRQAETAFLETRFNLNNRVIKN